MLHSGKRNFRALSGARERALNSRALALGLGSGRLGLGTVFLARPVDAVRVLGVDTTTASRIEWLARMTAARDAAIGIGTIVSAVRGDPRPWLIAGAACDAADAAALSLALGQRRLAPVPTAAMIVLAAAASALGASAAVRHRG